MTFGEVFSSLCLSWLCCLQPVAMLLLGITIGKYGGIFSAAGYFWRSLSTRFFIGKQE